MESCFRHRDPNVQMFGSEAELGVFRDLQVSLMISGQASGLEW